MSKKSSHYWEEFPKCLGFLEDSSDNTKRGYLQSIKKYETFHGKTIQELVNEALEEESVPQHSREIIDRLEGFQKHLIKEDLVYGTITNHMGKIKSIYHKNRVQIPYITPLNPKRIRRREYIEYKDILTKDEIKMALDQMRLPSQARALTIAQGGLSNEECEHLTTRTFIDETYKYHQCDDDTKALEWLAKPNHPIIWITKLVRVKTGKPYYPIIGAEAVQRIAQAKLYEKGLPKNRGTIPPKLLDTNKKSFERVCYNTNKKCNFGLVAEESKFRSHNLRRFHATHIRGDHHTYMKSSLSLQDIDEMQGRGRTSTQDTYIKSNPLIQKLLYAKVMNELMLFNEYEYEVTDDDIIIRVKDHSSENQKLKDEVKNLRKVIQEKQEASEKIDILRKELGEEGFKELVNEILTVS